MTDADLVLGYLDPDFFLGGRMHLDRDAAARGIETRLATQLGLGVARASWTVHEVVNENMANAARVHAVEAGADLRHLPLFAFGGAGPVHAFRVAMNLGMPLVIAPLGAGVGSTIGLLSAPLAFDYVRSAVMPLDQLDWPHVDVLLSAMVADGVKLLAQAAVPAGDVDVHYGADMRLVGQAHEIAVDLGARPEPGSESRMRTAFDATYRSLFGRQQPSMSAEVVSWRVRLTGPRPAFPMKSSVRQESNDAIESAHKAARQAYFPEAGGYVLTPVYDRYLLMPGMKFEGPAIVEENESTFVMGPGGRASIDRYQNLLVEIPE